MIKNVYLKNPTDGNSLAVQWLGLRAFTAEGRVQVQSLVRDLRSCKPHGVAKKPPQNQKNATVNAILMVRNSKLPYEDQKQGTDAPAPLKQ